MVIEERSAIILENIIRDYIELAQPISSDFLGKNHDFNLSSATLRIEMHKLTGNGYLFQPHTSSGRVPTDKAYRFFIDRIHGSKKKKKAFKKIEKIKQFNNQWQFLQEITKLMSEISSHLSLVYLAENKICWKDGWYRVFHDPEFENINFAKEFFQAVNYLEQNLDDLNLEDLKIYVGKEASFLKTDQLSLIIAPCRFGSLSILGPKRMPYEKNIELIDYLADYLKS